MVTVEELSTFCKKKAFAYPSCEIYGGLSGLYDYGHLGTLLKHNFENLWRTYFLGLGENFVEIEGSEIMHEKTFVASGHIQNFVDPVAVCKKGHAERADHLLEKKTKQRSEGMTTEQLLAALTKHKVLCPTCAGVIENVQVMNMMFPLSLGVGTPIKGFLRPETAQTPYVNFKREFEALRNKLPCGLAVVGRAYRNEISPRNFTIRQRAFTQAELQVFFNAAKIEEHEQFDGVKNTKLHVMRADARDKGVQQQTPEKLKLPAFYTYHMVMVQKFYLEQLGIPEEKFRLYELNEVERAFYNKYHFDVEVDIPGLGWTEVGGIHYRTDHDLAGHQKVSQQNLECTDENGKKFIPHVLELSFGVDRNVFMLISNSYAFDKARENTVLSFPANLAPFQLAVFPLLSNKEELLAKAHEVYGLLRKTWQTQYDKSGSVGRRYARQDEIGTPYCITVDFDSLKNNDVTIRDRDSTKQIRVPVSALKETVQKLLSKEIMFEKAGVVMA